MIVDDVSYAEMGPLRVLGSSWRNELAARSILTFDEYDPADSWDDVAVPTLLVATEGDRLAAFDAVRAFEAANPHVRVETFEGSHFDVYQPPVSDRVAALEADFLRGVWSGAP